MKNAISVTQMAKDLGLSRSRFYQLTSQGAFPAPLFCIETRRPFYDIALQEICHEVRKRNCGINGKVIMFYSPRRQVLPTKKPTSNITKENHSELIEALIDLGLTTVTANDVEVAVKKCFPTGTSTIDQGEVIRSVFLTLKS